MRLFKRKNRLELSYYLKRKQREARAKTKAKYTKVVIIMLIIPAIAITTTHFKAQRDYSGLLESISDNSVINVLRDRSEALRAKEKTLSFYDKELEKMGEMGEAIKKAGIEFGENEQEAKKLIGLIIGIANAESSLGKNFVVEYDKNCHNYWGLKGGNMTNREDGSHLRCFISNEAGARTIAKTLKLYYLDEGRDTPEKIVTKYVGSNWSQYHDVWVNNVTKYFAK